MSPEPIEGATATLISVGPHQGRTIRSLSDDELNVVLDALTTDHAWGTDIEIVSAVVLDKPDREVLHALARAYLQERQRRVQLYKAKAARERARQRRIENTPERRAARAAEKAVAQERERQAREAKQEADRHAQAAENAAARIRAQQDKARQKEHDAKERAWVNEWRAAHPEATPFDLAAAWIAREQQRRREWREQREQAGSQDSYPYFTGRQPPIDPELANQIFDAGYRVVARKHHPDVGGHHDTMAKLNDTIEGLRSRFPRPRDAGDS
jgi:hypothetical protein